MQNPEVSVPTATPIYLDHHATTPCDPRVLEVMLPYFTEEFGNPASKTHAFGWRAERAVSRAREQIASLIGASAREVIFTSGATESNNLALMGAARALRERGGHIVSCATEHRAVLDPLEALSREGVAVTLLGVGADGLVDLDELRGALRPETILVSVMHANNEIGVIQPIREIGRLTREHGALLHTDAAQSAGKLPIDVATAEVDLLSLTAHKMYGPKGIGALYVRRGTPRIEPILHGGGHERGLRSGTLPVPLCVGLGEACELSAAEMDAVASRLRALRNRLWERLSKSLDDVRLNGHEERRLPGNLNVSFGGVEGEALILDLPELAVSSGSACTSATRTPSHVLRALGVGERRALSSVRFGLGRSTTGAEVDYAAGRVLESVRRLRARASAPHG
jgi:cysteine desulfurase